MDLYKNSFCSITVGYPVAQKCYKGFYSGNFQNHLVLNHMDKGYQIWHVALSNGLQKVIKLLPRDQNLPSPRVTSLT